jgi:asparagine synthase (glutamine-hydrolysing)
MCGLAGVLFNSPDQLVEKRFLSAAHTFLTKRGPDDFAHERVDENVLFIHTRLSIIDIAAGHQPMHGGDGVIIYNGETYNYLELKNDKEIYRTNSDTEVLLRGIGRSGVDYLRNVDGMFALAHYDKRKKSLILARDLFGIKPLYYFHGSSIFAFASTMQPLMVFSQKTINKNAMLDYYTTRAVKAPNTVFDDIYELKAGEYLIFDCEMFKIVEHGRWAAPLIPDRSLLDEQEALAAIDHNINLAVRRHLVSDVPVASFLSGGVDSGLVTAIAARNNPDLAAFSIGFKDSRFDESEFAAAICRQYGIRHCVRYCDEADFAKLINTWPEIIDDVVADPSAVMLHFVAQLARESGFKVVLSGEGADELFAGYNRYQYFLHAKRVSHLGRFLPQLAGLIRTAVPSRSREVQLALHASVDPYYYGTGVIFEPYLLDELFPRGHAVPEKASTLTGALLLDISSRLPDDILTRTDRATMHASIEARVPFLTRYMYDIANACSERLLIKGMQGKYILKKLAERYIPRSCIYRRKVGFDLPLERWFRTSLKELLLDQVECSWQYEFINKKMFRRVVDDHMMERNNNADKLWAFLLLDRNVTYLKSLSEPRVDNTRQVNVVTSQRVIN